MPESFPVAGGTRGVIRPCRERGGVLECDQDYPGQAASSEVGVGMSGFPPVFLHFCRPVNGCSVEPPPNVVYGWACRYSIPQAPAKPKGNPLSHDALIAWEAGKRNRNPPRYTPLLMGL